MSIRINRRGFLAGVSSLLILPSARSAFGYPAHERLNLAVLGDMYVAGHFFTSIHAYDGLNLVTLGHPDGRKIPPVFEAWRRRSEAGLAAEDANERRAADSYRRLLEAPPRIFADFRRMLDEIGDRIDALVVSLFDHYHGPACGAAMRAGKHVFSERPLGLTIREARALRALAAETQVATSIRNPGNASGPFRHGLELIREGVLGPVEEVHVWFDRPGANLDGPPQAMPPVPDGLDWDLWLGPAAERPYHPDWMAYALWRDFSNGGIGTFGPHAANLAFMALKVQDLWLPLAVAGPPTIRVRAESPRINRLSFPRWERVRWQVPARGNSRRSPSPGTTGPASRRV